MECFREGVHQARLLQKPTRRDWLRNLLVITQSITLGIPLALAEQPEAANNTPQAAAASFYTWYLHELSLNHDPIEDSFQEMSQRAAMSTLNFIRRKRNSPDGMEADYFMQTQDYVDEWLRPPYIKVITRNQTMADLRLTLGPKTKESHELLVSMKLDGKNWKIIKIAKARKDKS